MQIASTAAGQPETGGLISAGLPALLMQHYRLLLFAGNNVAQHSLHANALSILFCRLNDFIDLCPIETCHNRLPISRNSLQSAGNLRCCSGT